LERFGLRNGQDQRGKSISVVGGGIANGVHGTTIGRFDAAS
jgi:hypothetical protein